MHQASSRVSGPNASVIGLHSHWIAIAVFVAALLGVHAWFLLGSNLTVLSSNHLDAFGHLPWMHRWADPALFSNDLMADYFQLYVVPPGLRGGYYALIQWCGIELNVACRVMAAAWYAMAFGMFLAVTRLALPDRPWMITLAGVTVTLIPFHLPPIVMYSLFAAFEGGLARAACAAVLLAAMYGIARPSRAWSNLAIVVGAACYPPAFVIATVAAGLDALMSGSWRQAWIRCVGLLPGTILAGVIVWLGYPFGIDPRFGPLIRQEDIAWAPEIAHLHFPHGQSLAGIAIGWCQDCWPAIGLLTAQAFIFRGGRLLRANAIMLVTGAVTTLVAFLIWPRLYEIARYVLWPRNAVIFVASASLISKAVEVISLRHAWWTAHRFAWIALTAYLAFVFALSEYRIYRAEPQRMEWAAFGRFRQRAIDFLSDTSKDTRVAALGEELDPVPTFAKRSMLLSQSALCPYHREFHREAIRRYLAIQDAVYATDLEPLRKLRDEYRVRYLSVNRGRFDPAKFDQLAGNFIAQTWLPERVAPIRQMGPHHDFILRTPPREMIVVEEGDYVLLDLQRMP